MILVGTFKSIGIGVEAFFSNQLLFQETMEEELVFLDMEMRKKKKEQMRKKQQQSTIYNKREKKIKQ